MKQAKDIIPNNTQKAPPPAQIEYTESDKNLAQRLFAAMRINYGALFMSSLDNQKDQEAWERSWMASIHGKNPETAIKAIKHCMDTQPRPFTRADFQQAYRALMPKPANETRRQPLGLPKNTWQERKESGRKHLDKIKEIVRW